MKDEIIKRLKEIEATLGVYYSATLDPSFPPDDKGVVSFKMMYEMIAFSTLIELVPEYKQNPATEFLIAQSLKNMKNLVNVQGGKIVVSQEYKDLLKHKDDFLKTQGNG